MIVQLLEREACLVSLAGFADEARHGEGRLVLMAGEAGVGKSALLFISVRTVDTHVSAVLAKLGTPTREAAARAAQLRLAKAAET